MGWSLKATLCNCDRVETIGLMDMEPPTYCAKQPEEENNKTSQYQFFVAKESHGEWKGYACWAWIHEKTIDGYFFGAFDTKEKVAATPVTQDECWKMANFLDCAGNKMISEGDISYFKAYAEGKGEWMQTKIFTMKQCEVRTITLSKDCPTCPVVSAFGPLTNDSSLSFVVHHQVSIVWKPPRIFEEKPCNLKQVHTGNGRVAAIDEQSIRLTDTSGQLDYIFQRQAVEICNQTMHKLMNIESGFIRLENDYFQSWTTLRNAVTKTCLTRDLLSLEPCTQSEDQRFTIDGKGILHAALKLSCFTVVEAILSDRKLNLPAQGDACNLTAQPPPIRYDYKAKTLSDGTWCIDIRKEGTANRKTIARCSNATSQKWITTNIPVRQPSHHIEEEEDKEALLLQHHQFLEDLNVERENQLEKEVKEIYCNSMVTRKHLTMLLASSNGLAAARVNKFPQCHRLKQNGDNLIVQKCKPENVTIGAIQTTCGSEPVFVNRTVGMDGFSIHPFEPCFHKGNVIPIAGKSYSWNGTEWEEVQPTFHLGAMRLVHKFKEVVDIESKYLAHHHQAFNSREIEQINILNDLASQVQRTNAESLSSIIMHRQSQSNFWDLSSWATSLKTTFKTVIIIAIVAVIGVAWHCCRKNRTVPKMWGIISKPETGNAVRRSAARHFRNNRSKEWESSLQQTPDDREGWDPEMYQAVFGPNPVRDPLPEWLVERVRRMVPPPDWPEVQPAGHNKQEH